MSEAEAPSADQDLWKLTVRTMHRPAMALMRKLRDRVVCFEPEQFVIEFRWRDLPDDIRFDEITILLEVLPLLNGVANLDGSSEQPSQFQNESALFPALALNRLLRSLARIDSASGKIMSYRCSGYRKLSARVANQSVRAGTMNIVLSLNARPEHRNRAHQFECVTICPLPPASTA